MNFARFRASVPKSDAYDTQQPVLQGVLVPSAPPIELQGVVVGEESNTEDLEALFPWTRAANTSVGSSYENDKVHFLKRDPSIAQSFRRYQSDKTFPCFAHFAVACELPHVASFIF